MLIAFNRQFAIRSFARGGGYSVAVVDPPRMFHSSRKSNSRAHFSSPQACRGTRLDKGVKIIHEADSKRTTYSIPAYADIMVAYSTYDGT